MGMKLSSQRRGDLVGLAAVLLLLAVVLPATLLSLIHI